MARGEKKIAKLTPAQLQEQARAKLQSKFLDKLRGNVGRDTGAWIKALSEETRPVQETRPRVDPAHNMLRQHQTMVVWVDRVFDILQVYATEYNRLVAGDYQVEVHRPVSTTKVLRELDGLPRDVEYFSGRIGTRHWTLILRGHVNSVDCFIIPGDSYIKFTHDESSFEMYMSMKPVMHDGSWKYDVNGELIAYASLPLMAKILFAALVSVCTDPSNKVLDERTGVRPKKNGKHIQVSTVRSDQSVQDVVQILLAGPRDTLPAPSLSQTKAGAPPELQKSEFAVEQPKSKGNEDDFEATCRKLLALAEQEGKKLSHYGSQSFAQGRFDQIAPAVELASSIQGLSTQAEEVLRLWKELMTPELRKDIARPKETTRKKTNPHQIRK